jgi:leader peptidase (prepilin peptidase)/N-methyltransferase
MESYLFFTMTLGAAGLFVGSLLYKVGQRVLQKHTIDFAPPQGKRDLYLLGHHVSTAVLFAWVGSHYEPLNFEWIAALLLVSILIIITHTDMKAMIIPNAVVFPGILMAVVLRAVLQPLPWWNYVAAAVIGFSFLYLIAVSSKGGMGGGDIKLYLFVGLIGGISVTVLSLFLASLLGMVYGLVVKRFGRQRLKDPIPFGPFIAVGAYLSFLYGEAWMTAYLVSWIT